MGIGECPYFFPLPSPLLLLPYLRGDRPPGSQPSGILLCAGWRLRRIDVKEQIPQFPAEHRELYQIAAPVIKRGGLGTQNE